MTVCKIKYILIQFQINVVYKTAKENPVKICQ